MAMTGIPSIGDVLLLSQLAWRMGCAFTAGRPSAPPEFHQVESELKTLTKSLDLLAEALDDDHSIFVRADDKVKVGVNTILLRCQQCLHDLNAFVARYQEIKRPESEVGTRGIQGVKTWKPILLKNWRSVWWTTEGGSIQALRNMLHFYVNFVDLMMKALQSRSLPHLSQTVESMVTQLDEVHSLAGSAADVRMEELHHLVADMVNQMGSETDSVDHSGELVDQGLGEPSSTEDLTSYDPSHTRESSTDGSSDGYRLESNAKFSADVTQKSPHWARSHRPDIGPGPPDSPRSAQDQRQNDGYEHDYFGEAVSIATAAEPTPARANMSGETPESSNSRPYVPPHWDSRAYPIPLLDRTSSQVSSEYSLHEAPLLLPPSDMSIEPHSPETDSPAEEPEHSTPTTNQQEAFKRELFRDTAILCEVPGLGIEYVRRSDDGKTRMMKSATDCQIILLRKRDVQPDGTVKFITSVWVISDDRSVRIQQKLGDEEVIPYTVWGVTEKVTLTVHTLLSFHGASHAAKALYTAQTNWVNYIFKDEHGANLFQSALMGRTLLLSVRTNKTLRVHDGIAGTFAYQERMCALENLRIWKDQDSNGVLAMIHYTPQFRDGYMSFYLNSQRDRVRISDAGDRYVKVKGLNISVEKPHSHRRGPSASNTSSSSPVTSTNQQQQPLQSPVLQRRNSIGETSGAASKGTTTTKGSKPPKKVTSARLEFTTEEDKRLFLEKYREVQGFFFAE